jgi:hypothetical protein
MYCIGAFLSRRDFDDSPDGRLHTSESCHDPCRPTDTLLHFLLSGTMSDAYPQNIAGASRHSRWPIKRLHFKYRARSMKKATLELVAPV